MALAEATNLLMESIGHHLVKHPMVGQAEELAEGEYDPAKSLGALVLHGLLAIINTVVPITLWYTWKAGGANMNQTNTFYWAWFIFWVSHLTLWGFPALMFFFTFWELDIANRIFLFSIDAISIAPFSVYLIDWIMFLVAAILNSDDANDVVIEVWVTWAIYTVLAGISATVQIIARQQLNEWYIHGGKITAEQMVEEDPFDTLDDIRFHSLNKQKIEWVQPQPDGTFDL